MHKVSGSSLMKDKRPAKLHDHGNGSSGASLTHNHSYENSLSERHTHFKLRKIQRL